MIALGRLQLNEEVASALEQKSAQLLQLLDAGAEVPTAVLDAYRAPGIKEHLLVESHGKCVYCESKITHVYWGDVEHIRPKASFPRERLTIENLCLACARCNNAKSDFWNAATPLLNPYEDDPAESLMAFGSWITRRPGRERARVTIDRLQLNRMDLVERRHERWLLIQPLVEQYVQTAEGPVREVIRNELLNQASDASEYALVVRAYLDAACNMDGEQAAEGASEGSAVPAE